MAEAMFKDLIKDLEGKDIEVSSAGTWAIEGHSASANAIKIMNERNIDLSNHRSTPLTKELIKKADLILTMTRNHKNQILSVMPEVEDKVYTLKEFVGYDRDDLDIADPFGGDMEAYRRSADEIESALKKALEKIIKS